MSQQDLASLVRNITTKLTNGEREAAGVLLDIAPQHPIFSPLRGLHASLHGDYTKALEYYQQAEDMGLKLPDLPYQKAQAMVALGRYQDVLTMLAQDDSTIALQMREEVHARLKQYGASLVLTKRLLDAGLRSPVTVASHLASAAKLCDWSVDASTFTDAELSPALLVFYNDDADQLNRVARLFASQFPKPVQRPTRPARKGRKLKIGYLSDDFRHHATAHLVAELFELHDKSQFEVFVFSYGANDNSTVRARIAAAADHFIDLAGKQALDIHNAMHDHQLDILVDMKGHAHNNMLPWLATRPAPLMLHYIGFPGPTAAPYIDFNVGDSIVTPPVGAKGHIDFADNILTLPGFSYQVNDRKRKAAEPLSRAAYGLPEDAIVLGSFNQTSKIRRKWFNFMLDVLQQHPRAVLWQYCDVPEAEAVLRQHMQQRGLAPERLVITGNMPADQHIARMAVADLMPDTIPCGGHTTTSEALWMGLPVVTLYGNSFASRVSASLLHFSGFDELIAHNFDEYKKLVMDLVASPDRLAELRLRIEAARNTAPLFDTPRWVHAWEAALTEAYDKVAE